MQIVMFYHSLVSDWNHGNAHFLRGVVSELLERGHDVEVYEPADSWSVENLISEQGDAPIRAFHAMYPLLSSERYDADTLDLDAALAYADLVIVHEWNAHDLVKRVGAHRKQNGHYRLLFHDTHHRSVTDPDSMAAYDLSGYDGVLAFGEVLREIYVRRGWAQQVWTWHEAADTRLFHPLPGTQVAGDLVWIGNWGDDERASELREFLIEPVRTLALRARVHGVRYPDDAKQQLASAGIDYAGWLPNFRVPDVFAQYRVTVHVPRRPYVEQLPGIPTIRMFEALACGIPLVSAPWHDAEGLFTSDEGYLTARNGDEMQQQLSRLLNDRTMAADMAARGRAIIFERHTCAHRVDELLAICARLGRETTPAEAVNSGD